MLAALAPLLAAEQDKWGYVTATYLLAFVVLASYALFVIRRGRKVGRQVPPEDRRWQ
jgi:hypothetical protein